MDATGVCYTQSGNVKRYEAQYGPRVWDCGLPLDFKRTNTGNTSYEYSLSVEGYECFAINDPNGEDDDAFIEVGYGDDDNGLEVIKTFYFKRTQININIYLILVALRVMSNRNVINKSTSSIVIDVDVYENGKDTNRSYGITWKVAESDYFITDQGSIAAKATISGIKYVEGMYVKISLNSATIINSEDDLVDISDTYTFPKRLHIVLPNTGAVESNMYTCPGNKYGIPRRYWYKCYSGEDVNTILWLNKNMFEFDSLQNIQYTADPLCWKQTLVNVKNFSNLNLTLDSVDNDDMVRIVLSSNRYNTDGNYSGVSVYGSMLKARGVVFNFQRAGVITSAGTGYDLDDGTGVRFGDVKSLHNDDNNTPLFLTLTEYDQYGYETLTSHLNTYVEMKSGVDGDIRGMYLCSSNPYIEALYPTSVHAFLLINEEIIDDMLPNVDYIDDMISDNSKLIFANLPMRNGTDQLGFPTMSSYYYHATFNVKDLIDGKAKYADITRTTYYRTE